MLPERIFPISFAGLSEFYYENFAGMQLLGDNCILSFSLRSGFEKR